jgi:SH3-like domain-containing protein
MSPRAFIVFALLFAAGLPGGGAAWAADMPRFYSLKSDDVNMREGPSNNHRVKWIYRRKGLPVEALAQYEVWRRVRDMDGEIGWVHIALLSPVRHALIVGRGNAEVRRRDDSSSAPIAFAQPGSIGQIQHCSPLACEVDFNGVDGWVDKARLWGVDDNEHF